MRLGNMEFTVVLMLRLALLLSLSLLVWPLMTWKLESAFGDEEAVPLGEANRTGVQGQSRNTNTFPASENDFTKERAAPLGTEISIEELRRIKEEGENTPVLERMQQQEDPSQ